MQYYRVKTKSGVINAVKENGQFFQMISSPFDTVTVLGEPLDDKQFSFLAPCQPSKVVAVGLNYKMHAAELAMALPEAPLLFLKPSTSVIGSQEDIIYPAMSARVDFEAELGVVIKKTCKQVEPNQADDYILGYTCLNDVTARDLQQQESQWTRAKSFDTFCPIGPYIETDFDWRGKRITAKLNGQVKQDSNTDDLIFGIEELVSFISHVMTLNPGDVIATGTPSGIGPMQRGDVVEVWVEGLGTLKNTLK